MADVAKALRQAFSLGQTYWQQADSEFVSQQRKSDETRAKFETLVIETLAELEAVRASAAPRTFSGVVEVCPDCDIADCFHIRARRAASKESA